MEVGLGMLRLPPDQFWSLTPREFYAAVDGFLESRGHEPARRRRGRVEHLRDMVAEEKRRDAARNAEMRRRKKARRAEKR